MAAVFPAPDHDHDRCSADALAHAEALCVKRGERLTTMRRHVLEVLAASHKPLGAYEIIEQVAVRGPRPAPITIYRALDFLTAQGLVHRIESRNAFLACINNHASGAPVVFLICEHCGASKRVSILTRKPVRPALEEMERNPRSRSSLLRVCERL